MSTLILKWLDRVDAQKKPQSKGGGAKSWWRWPLLIVLVLLGLAVGAYALNRNRAELAKLRHEKNKAEIEKENELATGMANAELEQAKDALLRVNKAERAIQKIEEQLADAEAKHAKDKAAIGRIGWGDLPRGDQ